MPDVQQVERSLSRHLELAVVIVLSMTAILTAWTAFQSTKWGGEQANNYSQAGARRTESVRFSTIAGQQTGIDVQSFIAWLEAHESGNENLATDISVRFREEFRPAFDAWIATNPFLNRDAPKTPFEMPEYVVAARDEANRLEAEAGERFEEAVDNNETGDQYVAVSVIFALSLFFGAVSQRFNAPRSQVILGGMALLVFLVGLGFTLTLPIQL